MALVVGGARGIGLAIARKLAMESFVEHVWITSRSLEAAKMAAKDIGGPVEGLECDVTSSSSIDAAINSCTTQHPLHSVVYVAGMAGNGLIARYSDSAMEEVIATNLTGALRTVRACVRRGGMLQRQKGSIVLVGSVVGVDGGGVGQVVYSASKAGLVGAARTLAVELGPKGIRTNVVEPGFVATDMTSDLPETRRKEMIQDSAINRPITPEEVAHAVVSLLHPSASAINGAILRVDGG